MDAVRTFTVILKADESGGFVVHVPALPEVCTQGETEPEALANAREAIELAIEERTALGEEIPIDQVPHVRHISVTLPHPTAA